ncbi:MAG: PDZ domain-containing protein [Streptosporangiaceae bacterium]|nr:PDZ domain-containing protein [Streptosporangiaceae bacterium]
MSRRSLTLLIASIGTAAAIAVTVLIPVPYVILGPGPTLNTLGKDSSGQELISIQGHPTHPTSGNLNMVTVSYAGGPGSNINIFSALEAWLNPDEAVVPEQELFPSGSTQQQVQQQDTAQMASSQQIATAAAFTELHIPFTTLVTIDQTSKGMPAASVLKPGDIITAVDGEPVTGDTSLTTLIRSHPAGTTLEFTIKRNGKIQQAGITTVQFQGHPVIGVGVIDNYTFPFNVKISIGDIGGPSAGLMFALGIIDKLTTDNLTGGKFIAGTGQIEPSGTVDAIGGIQQKMVGARNAGATVFLAPAANCGDTKGAVPAGLQVVKVGTLNQAVQDLEAIKAGKPVPSC